MLPYTRSVCTRRATIATPVMSGGPVVYDVISLSCLVSVLAYSQVYSSVERRAVKTCPNQPTLNLHSSLHLSFLLTLLYKIILQTYMGRVVIITQQHPPPQQCSYCLLTDCLFCKAGFKKMLMIKYAGSD